MSQSGIMLLSMALDFGGAETHVVSLAKAMKRQGKRVIVASNGGRLVPELEKNGIKHYQVALHARQPLQLVNSVGIVRRLVQQEKISLMHAHARIPAWVASRVSSLTDIPLVTTYHGKYNAHWLLRLFTTPGHLTIAVSEDVRAHLIDKLGVPEQQIKVIYNGIDLEEFAACSAAKQKHRVLYVSRLSGERGGIALKVMQAVDLLAGDYPEVEAVIVGEGDRLSEVQELAALIDERHGRQVCRVLGGRSDIPDLLAASGIVVGVGRVALEAMASGTPVIIAGEYGSYGLLEEAGLAMASQYNFSGRGQSKPTESNYIASELRRVFEQPSVAAQAAASGKAFVAANYSVDEKAREILKVYEKCHMEGNTID